MQVDDGGNNNTHQFINWPRKEGGRRMEEGGRGKEEENVKKKNQTRFVHAHKVQRRNITRKKNDKSRQDDLRN